MFIENLISLKMDDLQLNISVAKKSNKKTGAAQKNASEYKFMSKPAFTGKTIARKRAFPGKKSDIEHQIKVPKQSEPPAQNSTDLSSNLKDLSENKGKFQGKSYQDLSDDIQLKQKPRPGGWISSLFKNNPDVPRIGQRAVKPIVEKVFTEKSFSDLDIHPHSVANLQQNLGLKELMVVQQSAVPVILQGRDALIRSQTGSGKTLAYALPIVEALQAIRPKIKRHDGLRAVVVVPTRELAVQTYELFINLVKPFTWIVPGLLSGGQKRKAEKARLRKGVNILIGTPGRINDHLRHTQSLNFAKIGCLVLDEADCLLDMGYEKDVAAIVKAIEDHKKAATYDPLAIIKSQIKTSFPDQEDEPKVDVEEKPEIKHHLTEVFLGTDRQTTLLSATLTKAVENLAGLTMVDPVFVDASDGKALVADSLKAPKESMKPGPPTTKDIPIETKTKQTKPTGTEDDTDQNDDEQTDIPEMKDGLKQFRQVKSQSLFIVEDLSDSESAPVPFPKVANKSEPTKTKAKLVAIPGVVDMESDDEYVMPTESDKVANKSEPTKTKAKLVPIPGVVDMESDDEYVMPTESDEVANKSELKMKRKLAPIPGVVDMESDDEYVMHTEPDIAPSFEAAVKTAIKEDELVMPVSVKQTFLVVPMKLRLVTLCSLIVEHCVMNKKGGKLMVFMATLEMVEYHAELIETVLTGKPAKSEQNENPKSKKRKANEDKESDSDSEFEVDYQAPPKGGVVPVELSVFRLHGSMPHERRIEVFAQFRKAKKGVLFCTDVAARGLDVPRVDLVLQYCAPASATDYVHRVGRTGRASNVGEAVMFLLPSETEFMRHLEQKRIRLSQRNEKTSLEPLLTIVPGAANANRAAIAVQALLEQTAHTDKSWLLRASRAYTTWVRFYSGYPREVREFLDAKQLHLGHAAKAFALRDTPAALAKRAKYDPDLQRDRPANKLTVYDEEEKRRPGFPKAKPGFGGRIVNKQSSMHTASEFDSGLPPLEQSRKKNRKNK